MYYFPHTNGIYWCLLANTIYDANERDIYINHTVHILLHMLYKVRVSVNYQCVVKKHNLLIEHQITTNAGGVDLHSFAVCIFTMCFYFYSRSAQEENCVLQASLMNHTSMGNDSTHIIEDVDSEFNFHVYTGLVFSIMFFGFLRTCSTYHAILSSTTRLHHAMLAALIRSPMRMFDTKPAGNSYQIIWITEKHAC